MNSEQFKILKENGILKVNKNQIFFDGELFIVEQFEWVEEGEDMFSVLDGFTDFEDAYRAALNPEKYINSLINS
jgi:hypothetical protein